MWKQGLADNYSIPMLNRVRIFKNYYLIIFKLLTQKKSTFEVSVSCRHLQCLHILYHFTMVQYVIWKWRLHLERLVQWVRLSDEAAYSPHPFQKTCFAKFTVIEHVSSVSVSHIIMEINYLLHHNEIKIHLKLFKKTGFLEVQSVQMLDRISLF